MQQENLLSSIHFTTIYGGILLVLIILVLFCIILLGAIRIIYLKSSRNTPCTNQVSKNPLVSIHLPICNEPPHLVLKTINSVLKQKYEHFELIVLSNNTSNEELWKPIEAKIATLDSRFKFIHKEKVQGYKAGALNLALDYTDESADYIFTLDADYILEPNALNIAIGTLQDRKLQILQFPQSYRNTSEETNGIEINYKHYFDCYLSSLKSDTHTLPTGTLTLIDHSIFKKGFKWPTDSITEDASMGVDLLPLDIKIGFCNSIIGQGIMPTEPKDLNKQIRRWVFGNFQVLVKVLRSKELSWNTKLHCSTLLFAWMNLLGFVFAIFLFTIPIYLVRPQLTEKIFIVGFIGILIHSFVQIILFSSNAESNLKLGWKGFLIHLSLLEIGSFYWMNYLLTKEKPFVSTSKFVLPATKTNKLYGFPLIIVTICLVCFALKPSIILLFYTLFALFIYYAKYHRDKELRSSKANLYNLSK